MKVLAHRANVAGKDPDKENTFEQVRLALEFGFGLETDIRWAPAKGFYISHDPAVFDGGNDATRHAALWRKHSTQTIALNIKELGWEQLLVEFLAQAGVADQVFLFDMEFLESMPGNTAREYARLFPCLKLAARISDRKEPVEQALAIREASVIWLDEFDQLWVKADDVSRLKDAGKTVYAVSPELHGFSLSEAQTRWDSFAQWGVDGICTDHAMALCKQLDLFSRSSADGKEALCSTSN